MSSTQNDDSMRWMYTLFAVFAILWLVTLGTRALLNPDEGRYAEIPREMVVSGDWLTPRLNDLKYFEKPVLQYWATAAAYEAFGINEFASRFWCGFTGLLGVLFAGWAGSRLFGRSAGLMTAALLGCSLIWVILGHLNTLDMSLSFFLEVSILAFLLAQQAPLGSKTERNWMLTAWGAAALACLTKGLEAVVLPSLTLVVYTIVEREFSAWRRLHIVAGLPLFLAIAAPWFVAVSIANPEFAHFFFIHEHFERFLTDVHERVEPWWYFLPLLAVGALPWISLAIQSVRSQWRTDLREPLTAGFRPRRFLLLWVASIVMFFSASHSKLAPYILPVAPALALVTADFIAHTATATLRKHIVFIGAIWMAALLYLLFGPLPTKRDTPPELFATLFQWARAGAAMALLGAGIAWWLNQRNRARDAVIAVCLGTFFGLSVLLVGFDAARQVRSGYDLAQTIKPYNDTSKPFYSINDYDQTLPFYLGRTMTLVGYRGELDFGLTQEPAKGLPDATAFANKWLTDPAGSLAVMTHETYRLLTEQQVPMTAIGRNIDLIAVIKP